MERQKRKHRVGPVRPAFTLVELLVVITIIGMLIALVMPTISYVQELGRRTQCISNLKQLGLAMLAYEGENKSFPGWRNKGGYQFKVAGVTVDYNVSWVTMLLPYLEKSQRLLICPSDSPGDLEVGRRSYMVNGLVVRDPLGYPAWDPTNPLNPPQKDPPLLPRLPSLTVDYISGADGNTNTLMLGENTWMPPVAAAKAGAIAKIRNVAFPNGGFEGLAPYLSNQVNYTFGFPLSYPGLNTFAVPYGFPLTPGSSSPPWPNGTDNEISKYYNNNPMTANINSNHGGGAVVCFCDGHVQFLRDDVGVNPATGSDPAAHITVYQLLVTPDGSTIGGEPPADEHQFPQ